MNRFKQTVTILGIETSCDETAAAVVQDGCKILSNLVSSQVELHARYGGVVPEIASRHHLELINTMIDEALLAAKLTFADLDAIAVSYGPGLVGALLVGVATAKALAYALYRPLIGVNHLEAHLYANFLSSDTITFPLVGLIASGGHTELVHLPQPGAMKLLGRTRDDAAGEAYDKVARTLNLGYPGGPIIDRLALGGNPKAIEFPRAYLEQEQRFDFSFSGLKSAVINYLHHQRQKGETIHLPDLAASFQMAVVEVLVEKTVLAARETNATCVLLSGGVAANSTLRREMELRLQQELPGVSLLFPPTVLCTDNAAMIAAAAYPYYRDGRTAPLDLNAVPNLPLDLNIIW